MVEAENTFDLVEVDVLLDFDDVGIKFFDVFDVTKDESLFWVKTECDDVFNIVNAHLDSSFRSFKFKLWTIYILLVICNLDNHRDVKSLLHVLTHDERNRVSKMKCFSRWTTASVQIIGFLRLVCFKNVVQVSVAEKDVSAQESMWLSSCQFLHLCF